MSWEMDERLVKNQLQKLNELPIQSDPYLATRTIAIGLERKKLGQRLLFWKRSAVGFLSLFVAVVGFQLLDLGSQFQAAQQVSLGAAVVIQLDLDDLKERDLVAEAEIILPDGVKFLAKNEALTKQAKLRFPWNWDSALGSLSFLVAGHQLGKKKILVNFYKGDRKIHSKEIKLEFINNEA